MFSFRSFYASDYFESIEDNFTFHLSMISNKEIFLQDFLVILKRSLQNYYKILKKCFLCPYIDHYKYSIFQPHNGVSPVAKKGKFFMKYFQEFRKVRAMYRSYSAFVEWVLFPCQYTLLISKHVSILYNNRYYQ